MPLQQLVEYFNQRFTEEQGLSNPPLRLNGTQVEGTFGGLCFGSILEPVRLAESPSLVIGHDTSSIVPDVQGAPNPPFQTPTSDEALNIVNLDRLNRTVHMLNYLPVAHEEGHLFLHVHPRHVLAVKRDHGAYFEEIIQRCGLLTRRVVITLLVSPVYDRHLILLLERLRNYRDRGYSTAIKFDDRAGESFLERYCIEFLYRFTPDFVRFDSQFFPKLTRDPENYRRRSSLLSAIRRLDTQLLIERINSEADADLAKLLQADLVKGIYYERCAARKPERILDDCTV
ncbi:EAL domain-containing protein [Methylocaldum sp.]|uniref:EAL domain-containing protein n=1 Tax=Methylocaldum sp. TaxID=1969727 RepID=UPI002D718712|nr:EAL domain-containing protein [Methylocaldum sp.]HYE35945.1 EAL domain-containing protein [Methylocaldum sp.]